MLSHQTLNCPHNEIKLKQNSFKTAVKLFQFHFHFDVRAVFDSYRISSSIFQSQNVGLEGA